jgi:hypothetical protein
MRHRFRCKIRPQPNERRRYAALCRWCELAGVNHSGTLSGWHSCDVAERRRCWRRLGKPMDAGARFALMQHDHISGEARRFKQLWVEHAAANKPQPCPIQKAAAFSNKARSCAALVGLRRKNLTMG